MKYISIDIETTGLDEERHQILSIGAIIEDTENILDFKDIPKFHMAILHKEIIGSPEALAMNSNLISNLANRTGLLSGSFTTNDCIADNFFQWICENNVNEDFKPEYSSSTSKRVLAYPKMKPYSFTAAGKNFGTFDKKFLEKLPDWKRLMRIHQRVIDPAILYVDWQNDTTLPNLNQCLQRANIEREVSHDALEDAWDVIQVLRHKARLQR